MLELDKNAHSVFMIYFHLVLTTKYRRKVLDDKVSARAKEIFEYIAPAYKITLQEWNHNDDHILCISFKAVKSSTIDLNETPLFSILLTHLNKSK